MKFCKALSLIFAFLALCSCADNRQIFTTPPDPAGEAKFEEAERLCRKGCLVPLKKAYLIYQELKDRPAFRRRISLPLLNACLLIVAREKELAIPGSVHVDEAARLIRENPALADRLLFLEMAAMLSPRTEGVIRDIDTNFTWKKTMDQWENRWDELKTKCSREELSAYLFAAWCCSYGSFSTKKEDPADFLKIFPSSVLLNYQAATCGRMAGKPLLEEILRREPEFIEARYHLGRLFIQEGKPLSAEKELFEAFSGIPESPQILILLASVYFATEEYEKALEFYEKTLAVSPEYRDALLGKAVSLCSMNRYEESMTALENILRLGYWLLGEAHYWLAWNQHALARNQEASAHIDEAKNRLPTNSEVFSLSGTIAFALGRAEKAEKDFKASLRYNDSNAEALFGLGQVYAAGNHWRDAAAHFEKAAWAMDRSTVSIKAKIAEIQASEMAEERKKRLIWRKEQMIQALFLSKAGAFFSGAECFFNGGERTEVRSLALKAAECPVYKSKAEELLKRTN